MMLTRMKKNLQIMEDNDTRQEIKIMNEVTEPPVNDAKTSQSNSVNVDSSCPEKPSRETWSHQLDFLLSIVGYAVDLANVWRFPYVCYNNGGGAFLIPYIIVLSSCAIPLFYLELILGQKHRRAAIGLWDICPMFRGIGYVQTWMTYAVSFYYNTIVAWCLYFLMASFTDDLPWLHCDERRGNSRDCIRFVDLINGSDTNESVLQRKLFSNNRSLASSEYFERVVLSIQRSAGLSDLGPVRWQLFGCSFVTFLTLYICLRRGIKTAGKVVYVTALCPYLLLLVLLVNGLTLDGSAEGIRFFLLPSFEKLAEVKVWVQAAIQIFFSTGVGFGVHIAYASYNNLHHNIFRDCLITAVVNSLTSIFSGCTVFAYLGYLSHVTHIPVGSVAGEGPGLVFQVYPFAVGTLPLAPLWSVTFFLLLIMLGVDSGMGGLGSAISAITDVVPEKWRAWKHFQSVISLLVVGSAGMIAMVNVTSGGMYIFNAMDRYIAGVSLLTGVFFQVFAVAWVYGMDRLCADIVSMRLPFPNIYWRVCWKVISPGILVTLIISSLVDPLPLIYKYGTRHPELLYNYTHEVNVSIQGTTQTYNYPIWISTLGHCLECLSFVVIIVYAVVILITNKNARHCISMKDFFSIGPSWRNPCTSLCKKVACRKRNKHEDCQEADCTQPVTRDSTSSNLVLSNL